MKEDEDTEQESIFEFKEDNNKKQSSHFNNSNNNKNTEIKKSLRDLMNGDFWS
jgi:DnaJ-domain-containing protein 1